jgi:hypothetical protein
LKRLPDRLGRVSPRLRRLLAPLWLLLFLVTLIGQGGGLWYAHAYITIISPAFGALGLRDANVRGGRGFTVELPANPAIPDGSRIVGIDDRPLSADATQLDAARVLAGVPGDKVALDIKAPDGAARRILLTRDTGRAAEKTGTRRNLILGFILIFGLLAVTYVGAAVMLWRRKREDPVSALLSFAFLAIAASGLGPLIFFGEIGAEWVVKALVTFWLLLLLITLPAFPDGRFVPRWSRWLLPLAPAWVLFSLLDFLPDAITAPLLLLMLILALVTPVLRYRRSPPGMERQQLKWAALGLGAGTALLTLGLALALASTKGALLLPELLVAAASMVLIYVGFLLIPAGVILSLLRYRLNDADAAIGRSTGYAAVTAIVGAVWAMSAFWAQEMLPEVVGRENKGLATAVAGLVAFGIFAPVRSRLLRWAEARFQRALVRLRGLPVRLGQLQHGDDPGEVAQVALEALERGIEASSGAIVDAHGERLAVRGGEGPFVLTVDLADPAGPVATLMLGPRSDGASYSRDQRTAVATIAPSLADALRATSRRGRDKAALAATLTAIEQRLAGLERRSGPASAAE